MNQRLMIEVKKEGILLEKTALGFESHGVLNPAVLQEKEEIHLFYRAVSKDNYSTIGYCKLDGPMSVIERLNTPILFPQNSFESHGVEDPRIVKIDDLYYMTYTAYDGNNSLGALAISADLQKFEKMGIIVPCIPFHEFAHLSQTKTPLNDKYLRYNESKNGLDYNNLQNFVWDKNLIFFPRKINGYFYFIHRIKPDIQIVKVDKLESLTPSFWQSYFLDFNAHILMSPKYEHEVSYIGGGCPPIETKDGWLLIYHGVHDTLEGYVYSACVALLDLTNPSVEIARLHYPLFSPVFEWEKTGLVNNVCFPSGAIVLEDKLHIYYGATDEHIACATVNLSALLDELLSPK